MGRSRASIRCYVPVNEKSPFLDSPPPRGGETSWVSLLPFSLLYMWQKALVDERGPVSFLASVNVGEEEEQLVQEKKRFPRSSSLLWLQDCCCFSQYYQQYCALTGMIYFYTRERTKNRNHTWEKSFRSLYNSSVTLFLKMLYRYCDNSFLEMSFRH